MATNTFLGGIDGNWNTDGNWSLGHKPTASEDVVFNNTSPNCALNTTTGACRSLDFGTGATKYSGTFSGSAQMNVGDGTAGAGNIALRLSSTMTWTYTGGAINFISTSTTQQTITWAGITIASNPVYNGAGGSWIHQDATSASGRTASHLLGTLNTNNQSCVWGAYSGNSASARVLTLGSSAISLSLSSNTVNVRFTNLTVTSNTSVITLTASNCQLNHLTLAGNWNGTSFVISGINGSVAGTSGMTCANFTKQGSAIKTEVLTITAEFTVTGTLTLGGNSTQGVNRLLVTTSVPGLLKTITCTGAAVVITGDTNFEEIEISGSPSWTNAGAAYIGDCGANGSFIISKRTAPASQTSTGTASFTWSTHGWTSRVPLPQDDVSIPNAFVAGRTITADMPQGGRDIIMSCTGSPILTIGAQNMTVYGSWAYPSAGLASTSTTTLTLAGRGTHTFTNNGAATTLSISYDCGGGNYTLQDAWTSAKNSSFFMTLSSGTFNTANQSVTQSATGSVQITFAGGTFNGGTSTLSFNMQASSTFWNVTSSTAVVNCSNTVVQLASSSAVQRTFNGGNNNGNYGSLVYTVGGSTGTLRISGVNNTWAGSPAWIIASGRSVVVTAAATQILSGANALGSFKGASLAGGTAGTRVTLSLTSLTVSVMRAVTIQDIGITQKGHLYALDASVDGGNNDGITFNKAPGFGIAA